jgi:protein ImuB
VWFPNWPIQRLRSERPELRRSELVLFAEHHQRLLVTVFTPRAGRQGVRIGQPLTEAKALIRKAVFLPADGVADRQALCQLALDAQRFSPLVGVEEGLFPESLLGDVTGCTHLWDGEERFLRAVHGYWKGRSFHVQLALAGSVGAAWARSRAGTAAVIPEGEEEAALSRLPVELLRLPSALLERLDVLGLRTISDILQLPRPTLAGRFGMTLPLRLDQAFGLRPESIVGERLCEPLSVIREWEVPLDDRLTVALVCRQMLRELLSVVNHPGAGLQELEGELRTEVDIVRLVIRLVEPSRDEQHLAQLMELRLERTTWSGGVVAIQWTVLRLGSQPHVQRDWLSDDGEADHSQQVVALVERLRSRLGDDGVVRGATLPDAQPECAVSFNPWTNIIPAKANAFFVSGEQSRRRPCRLLRAPHPIAVVSMLPGGPPIRMTWLQLDRRVIRSWGPERIATGWWREADIRRDYYRAEWEDGTHVWIFCDLRSGGWFMHGFFE